MRVKPPREGHHQQISRESRDGGQQQTVADEDEKIYRPDPPFPLERGHTHSSVIHKIEGQVEKRADERRQHEQKMRPSLPPAYRPKTEEKQDEAETA
jgi:hypothetical protein